MRLYTPLSRDEADRAETKRELPGPTLWWLDRLVADEAQEDSVWVAIDVKESEVTQFEEPFEPSLAYREFELPSDFAARHRVFRGR